LSAQLFALPVSAPLQLFPPLYGALSSVQDRETTKLLSDKLVTATVRMHSRGHSSELPLRLLGAAFHSGIFEGARQLMTTVSFYTRAKS